MFFRIYTGEDGRSHFADEELPPEGMEGITRKATEITIRRTGGPGTRSELHNAPVRQYAITLQGWAEFIVGDGTFRIVGPGDVLLCEDTTGEGHWHRVLGTQSRIVAFVPVES